MPHDVTPTTGATLTCLIAMKARQVLQGPTHAHQVLAFDWFAWKGDFRQFFDREAPPPLMDSGDQAALYGARSTAHEKCLRRLFIEPRLDNRHSVRQRALLGHYGVYNLFKRAKPLLVIRMQRCARWVRMLILQTKRSLQAGRDFGVHRSIVLSRGVLDLLPQVRREADLHVGGVSEHGLHINPRWG